MASAPTSEAIPTGAAATRARRRSLPFLLLEAGRPKHWLKNLFVLGGIIFSGNILSLGDELRVWTLVAAFCLASSATYLLNDSVDAETDRYNPRTAGRPIARGDLSIRAAITAAALASLVALGLAALVNWKALLTLVAFMVLQVAYSFKLKQMLFVDVMAVAAGFVLRAYAGLVAFPVRVSPWLLTCTGLLALFLGFAKRRAEVVALGGAANPQRPVLDNYSLALLDELMMVVTPTTLVVYVIYCVQGASTDLMTLTAPFVMYGIFRVLFLIHHRSAFTEEPALIVFRDRPLLICIALWAVAAGVISVIAA